MTVAMLMSVSATQAELNQDLKQYAQSLELDTFTPRYDQFKPVLKTYFPNLESYSHEVQKLLEELGIVVIVHTGTGSDPKRISWSITLSAKEAEIEKQRHLSKPYLALREALNISHHWIFVTPDRDLLLSSWDELVDASGDFRLDGQPTCWIVTRFI